MTVTNLSIMQALYSMTPFIQPGYILTSFFLLSDGEMENSWRTELSSDDTVALQIEMPNYSDDKSNNFHCGRCGKQYLRKRTLQRHMRYDCGTEPRFPCFICGLRFRRRYALTSHLVAVHGVQRDEVEYSMLSLFGTDKESAPY